MSTPLNSSSSRRWLQVVPTSNTKCVLQIQARDNSHFEGFSELHHLAPTAHSPFATAEDVPCQQVQHGPCHRDGWRTGYGQASRTGKHGFLQSEGRKVGCGQLPGLASRASPYRAEGDASKWVGSYQNGSKWRIHCSSFQDTFLDTSVVLRPLLISDLALDCSNRTTPVLRVLRSTSFCQPGQLGDDPQALCWIHLETPHKLQHQPLNELQMSP